MGESILESVKHLLGPGSCDDHFDDDLIIFINGVFSQLTQLGVGPEKGFFIDGPDKFWEDYISNDPKLEMVKTYMYQKVRLIFDPPASSAAVTAMEKSISEFEWRINAEVDYGEEVCTNEL